MKRGRKPNPPVEPNALACTGIVRQARALLDRLAASPSPSTVLAAVPPEHGNTRLRAADALTVLLAAFYNPTVRSLRLIEQLSQVPWVDQLLGVDRACKSTLADALARFEPDQLLPLIARLAAQVPHLARLDGDLADVCGQVLAADGSYWNAPADVLWALAQNRGRGRGKAGGKVKTGTRAGGGGKTRRAVRVNWQFDVSTFTPVDLSVSGADEGSEPAAFAKDLRPGVVYVVDRNFVHFAFVNAVLDVGSDLVLRLRADTKFVPTRVLPPSPADVAAGVVSDRAGTLPGSARKQGKSRTGPPPARGLREVICVDPQTGQSVRLLTSLMDVPAHVIARAYRHRWQIELFFRWLKVWANFDHLLSHSKRGVTTQFYVAVVACLLMHVRTGRKVNKYAVFVFGQVASGLLSAGAAALMLDRVEREKDLERQRLARKRALAKKPAALPA